MSRRSSTAARASLLVALVAIGAAVGTATDARAAACCMTSAMFGVGRLKMWEHSAAGSRLGVSAAVGTWGADGAFHPSSAGYFDDELRIDNFGIARLTDALEISANVPVVETLRGVTASNGAGAAFGDAQLGLRYQIIDEHHAGAWPTVAVLASGLLPTGRRVEDARALFAADANSRGAFGLGGAVSLEETVAGVFFAHLDVGATGYLPATVAGAGLQQLGPTLGGVVSLGGEPTAGLVVGAFVSATYDMENTIAGKVAPRSAALVTTTGVVASWNVDAHWSLVASAGTGVFVDGAGANRPGQVSGSAGVRFGFS